ncbi:MAG: PAS domain-containing protein [bacterium]|nr:PAS domain-containing protein [bacterium]
MTLKKNADPKNNDQERLLQTVIDTVEGEIFVKDKNGKYQFVNSAFCEDFGVKKNEIIGKDDYFAFPPEAAAMLQQNDKRIMQSKTAETIEESSEVKGKFVTYRTNKVPLIDEDGEVHGICGIGFDITEQKKLEEERDELIKELKLANSIKDKLFSVIAHELKSPFNGLLNLTQLLSEESGSINQSKILQELVYSSKNTYLLLENLLTWSLAQRECIDIEKKIITLKPLITECAAPYLSHSQKKNIRIEQQIPEDMKIFADEHCTRIVLNNLINNAIKFTPQGGSITISAQLEGENMGGKY